ncbi:AraC family transcriptional regulator [Devosia sp. CN2-171]|uniref:AraC family transcriptional regulator n=1 Tax=Devosia sp. CN2-171 TaxID=3400909 RepID=UPI003BF8C427
MSLQSYETRVNRVTAFIYDHLDEALDLDRLADVAAMSRWHWHRVYSAMRGETVAAAVRRLRLQRAAALLVNGEDSVEDVARRSGYDNLQSFTRIFSDAYGMPPARYRKEGSHAAFNPAHNGAPTLHYDIEVRHVPARRLVVQPHTGSYMNIGKAFGELFGRLGMLGLVTGNSRMIGAYLDDPSAVEEGKLRSLAGALIEGPAPVGMETYDVEARDYAVLRYKGPYSDMRAAYNWMFGTWLPQSGREAADVPVLEEYLNNPRDTPPAELLTDLYLPLV